MADHRLQVSTTLHARASTAARADRVPRRHARRPRLNRCPTCRCSTTLVGALQFVGLRDERSAASSARRRDEGLLVVLLGPRCSPRSPSARSAARRPSARAAVHSQEPHLQRLLRDADGRGTMRAYDGAAERALKRTRQIDDLSAGMVVQTLLYQWLCLRRGAVRACRVLHLAVAATRAPRPCPRAGSASRSRTTRRPKASVMMVAQVEARSPRSSACACTRTSCPLRRPCSRATSSPRAAPPRRRSTRRGPRPARSRSVTCACATATGRSCSRGSRSASRRVRRSASRGARARASRASRSRSSACASSPAARSRSTAST